ncbi:NAD-dependent epimerase/dehydratase family protein [Occallatibacter savannae]|uniref:NAD-dependent epimerase/dehydratase family protein n=1 Tax=Occallatibacter savannae TaxID=1002691 RepID=UPI000D69657B|nr:NAD-dependent epimerase/dehydratase family protein [Occallatibacter savannae]
MRTKRHPIVEEDLRRIVASPLPWERFFGKTVLITGANGFVPAYMLETLIHLNDTSDAGIHVVAMVRNREKAMRRLGEFEGRRDLTVHVQDVRDAYSGPTAVNFVVHAASQASPKFFGVDPVGTFEANVIGTQHLLQLAHASESEGFLFFSSGEVYGQPADCSTVKESDYGYLDPLNVRSCYAEGKRAGETLCACWHAQFGVPAKIVRLSHTYGPGMELNDGRVFADFVANIVAGQDIVLKSDGSATRPFCYLADATEAHFRVLLTGKAGEAYNLGSGMQCSVLELAEMLCRQFPEQGCKVVRQARSAGDAYVPSAVQGFELDLGKIHALGWKATTSIEEGFRRTVESYR